MERFLLFDSGCTLCTNIAHEIEQISDGWLQVKSLNDLQMQALLQKAKPDWKWEPTLLEVDGQHIKVFTGPWLRAKIGLGLGTRRAWLISQRVYRAHLAVYENRGFSTKRRTFLKQASMAIGALVFPLTTQSTSQFAGHSINQPLWTRVSPIEAKKLAASLYASARFHEFAQQLTTKFSIGKGTGIFGQGDKALLTVPVTYQDSSNGSAFTAIINRKSYAIEQSMGWTIETDSNGHHARVQLNGRIILDAIFDDRGFIVAGWASNALGQHENITGQNNVALGRQALSDLQNSIQTSGTGTTIQRSSFDCLNSCLSNAGIPMYLLALIGTLCAIACAITVGFGCFACLSGLLGGLLGTGLGCLANCGYTIP